MMYLTLTFTLQAVSEGSYDQRLLFGATHLVDLVLARSGEFINWKRVKEAERSISRTICVAHYKVLFTK